MNLKATWVKGRKGQEPLFISITTSDTGGGTWFTFPHHHQEEARHVIAGLPRFFVETYRPLAPLDIEGDPMSSDDIEYDLLTPGFTTHAMEEFAAQGWDPVTRMVVTRAERFLDSVLEDEEADDMGWTKETHADGKKIVDTSSVATFDSSDSILPPICKRDVRITQ